MTRRMESMVLRLADAVIAVRHIFPYAAEYCKKYVCDVPPDAADIRVCVTADDIAYERAKSEKEDVAAGRAVQRFSDEYLETLAIYRKIAERMPDHNTILFHGSVIAVDGEGYLFTAKSGTGKSTHTRLWRERFGERAVMVNDDKPLIRIADGAAYAYGTPWNGKHHLDTDIAVPLKGLCILSRAKENHIEPADRRAAYPMIVQQTYRPSDPRGIIRTMELIDGLMDSVRIYSLGCNMDPDAALTAYNGMQV